MDIINNSNYQIILGSGSSRRKELLEMTGIKFTVNSNPVNENFPESLRGKEIAEFIVSKKTKPFREIVKENQIIITADTLVWFEDKCWGKPNDKNDAKKMLKQFAGLSHEVITSVGFLTSKNFEILTEVTEVTYKDLNEKEINYYVDTVNPIDKAGSYGIQDWIGMIGVERIKGSYTSVLGLPVPQVTGQILKIINENL
ncbi:Maf family nucleotide pyrophosphatase [Flavobacteriaceae bacterium]|jgi:septum formation protein|nr:Maf family nucleotide pyrophosphatase [Flavobacteriaceae bacterium]MDC1010628.1 Maf family nucleotide pyrophosphatase [Flavobacteriaceae bacterium]MDC1033979.1 Maf family nucleotide pyrophosphatase [Flavobacteriaceae bacterium]